MLTVLLTQIVVYGIGQALIAMGEEAEKKKKPTPRKEK